MSELDSFLEFTVSLLPVLVPVAFTAFVAGVLVGRLWQRRAERKRIRAWIKAAPPAPRGNVWPVTERWL